MEGVMLTKFQEFAAYIRFYESSDYHKLNSRENNEM